MSKYSSNVLYLLLSILIVIAYVNGFGPVENLQRSINDYLCQLTAPEGTRANVALVMIDDRAEDEFGKWPWNRDVLADLMAATASGEPKVIVLNTDLIEDAYQDSAGYTSVLADQLTWIDNAILPYDIALATFRSQKTNNPEYLFHYSITVDNPLGIMDEQSSLLVRRTFLPAERLLESKPLLGFAYVRPDDDRLLRHQPLFMNYEGYYYPSLSLLAAATYLGVSPSQIQVREGLEVAIGSRQTIPVNSQGEYFISHLPKKAFVTYSAADVLSDDFNRSALSGKVILIGVANGEGYELATPMSTTVSAEILRATIIENIINDNILMKFNRPVVDMLILFALGALCAFVLPLLTVRNRLLVLTGSLAVTVGLNYYLVSSLRILPETIYIGLELIAFIVAAPIIGSRFLGNAEADEIDPANSAQLEPVQTSSSKSTNAPEPPVRTIKQEANDPALLGTRALGSSEEFPPDHQAIDIDKDFEDDSSGQAEEVNETIASSDIDAIVETCTTETDPPSEERSSPQIIGFDSPPKESAPPIVEKQATEAQPLPAGAPDHLGRYQVTGNLGKGAMGMVYKGIDPAINRPVALKTIRLDFVNDPEEMEELKERLFREAQAAGKLSHPNIVTIYDVGSEDQLQYIAMEFLEGQTLEDMIKKKVQFNYRIIAQIIIQICSALQYAHEQGIVHRDIKPANIMIGVDYRVKVMDYGIARIDSNSMTKTGIAMGTPNYISPEQLKGLTTDHRADLFSLGVVLYEMLLGKRPFKGENITSLIYSVMNHEAEKPSTVNPQIPLLFDRIIWKVLEKNPDARYQKASDIAADLNEFVESFAS
ncbi:MAG: protein kinase [candidate division Zixibacteria bacterium]|nr:protein kinase [candidate division Zixibacteria bacterium]